MAGKRAGNVRNITVAKLWAKSAGRCEYDGCNKLLYKDDLTSKEINRSYVAHIVAASPDGPRGDEILSAKLVDDIDNIMLLCSDHHRLIDHEGLEDHPVERLQEMKKKHENRIRQLTEIDDSKISIPLLYAANIGQQNCAISRKEVSKAMLPENYPSEECIEISLKNSETYDSEESYWALESNQIEKAVSKALDKIKSKDGVDCVSVFALAPQPLLVKLGSKLNDLHRVKVFQKHREPDTWCWQENSIENHIYAKVPTNKKNQPVLVFALSASAIEGRVRNRFNDDASIWVVTANLPGNDMLKSPEQLSEFRTVTRSVLDDINASSDNESIKVFMAMPASCAVELGRVWMPKADKALELYDKNNNISNDDIETFTIK